MRSPFIQLALQMASHQLEPPPPQDPNAEVEEIVPDSFCSHLKPEFQHSHPHLAAIVQMSGNRKLAGFHFLPHAHFFLLAHNFGQFFVCEQLQIPVLGPFLCHCSRLADHGVSVIYGFRLYQACKYTKTLSLMCVMSCMNLFVSSTG